MSFKKGDIVRVKNTEDVFECIIEIVDRVKQKGETYRGYVLEVIIENEDVVTNENIKPSNMSDIDDGIHILEFGEDYSDDALEKIKTDNRTKLSILMNDIYKKQKRYMKRRKM